MYVAGYMQIWRKGRMPEVGTLVSTDHPYLLKMTGMDIGVSVDTNIYVDIYTKIKYVQI